MPTRRPKKTELMKPAVSTAVAVMPPVIVIPAPDLEVINCEMVARGQAWYLQGTVRNNSRHTFLFVEVDFNLYEVNGDLLGNKFDSVRNLESGVTWRFSIWTKYSPTGAAPRWKITQLNGRREDPFGRSIYFSAQPAALLAKGARNGG